MESLLLDDRSCFEIEWLSTLISKYGYDKASLMRLAIEISCYSAANGGGPFGAVIADADGKIIECGCNQVLQNHDSTAHAEIVAIRRAQKKLATHDLGAGNTPVTLYTSCSPCIQCFGAIYWSGIRHVVAGATKDDAQSIGFDEGCITKEAWDSAKQKNIEYELNYLRNEAVMAFEIYKQVSGVVY